MSQPTAVGAALPFVNFNHLRSFHAVAQQMSFTNAARLLHLGQPTLTVQVRELEERFGVELFVRTQKSLKLSATGIALFEVTKQIFSLQEQAVNLLRSTGGSVAGRLKVGTVGPFFVMRVLAEYQNRYPLVQVGIDSDNTDGAIRKVLETETDVAVTGNVTDDARLITTHLGSHQVVLFINREHPWARLTSIKLAQLDGQRMLIREQGSMTRAAFEESLKCHRIKPRFAMELDRDAMREGVFEGLGIGIVSQSEFRAHDDLRVLTISDYPSCTHSYVICLRARRHLRPIAAFMELAQLQARVQQLEQLKEHHK